METSFMKKFSKRELSSTHIIMLSFVIAILIGSLLLALPISSASGKPVPYLDALFMATTATCVTGLVTLPTISTWSLFGQVVILILIQIGGLGIVTILSGLMIYLHKRIGLKGRILLQDTFNLNSLSGLIRFTKKVILGTFIIEGIGAVLYMFVFIPEFGLRGIWISVFTSVSAFCNAGIDVIAENSLCNYTYHPLINLVTSLLIILGGIGFIVWWDVIRIIPQFRKQGLKSLRNLTLHSKITLSFTAFLILFGGIVFYLLEFNNPLTLQDESVWNQLQAAFFQSVTTRTAGFAALPQENLSNASAIFALLLMFIGGSPVGTAGGVKTVTIVIIAATMIALVRNKNEVVLFHRNISRQALSKAVAVACMSFLILFISTVLLAAVTDASALDVIYETVSATATVGLSRNLTSQLNVWGKIIIIFTMFLGRIGPISLAVAFSTRKESPNLIKNPTEEISVG